MTPSYRVIVSPRAFSDLDAILDYVTLRSPANARRVIDRLWEAMHGLARLPRRYRVVSGPRQPGRSVRRMPGSNYLVYYRIDDQQQVVRILSVWHGARRQPKRFG